MKRILTCLIIVLSLSAGAVKADDVQPAQCLFNNGTLTALAIVKTIRGAEFFNFTLNGLKTEDITGIHDGVVITSVYDQAALPSSCVMEISKNGDEGEARLSLNDCDLKPLTVSSDFDFVCKITAY